MIRRLAAWLLVALVVMGGALGAAIGAAQSPRLVLPGSTTFQLLQQAVDRTIHSRTFIVRHVQVHSGRHPYVFHFTLRDDGPYRFETVQSFGRASFVKIVNGSRAFETAAGAFGEGTSKADIARATKELAGKFIEIPPYSTRGDLGAFAGLEAAMDGFDTHYLSLSQTGSVFTFSTPDAPYSGAITVEGGRAVRATLNVPGVHNEYDFTDFNERIRIQDPSPTDIVTPNPVTGCIEVIPYSCVR